MGEHRDADTEQRGQDLGAEQASVALVVRVGDERDAGRHELGPSRLDLDRGPVARCPHEAEAVVEARLLLVDELGLGDGGLEVDVPQRRRLVPVGLVARQQAEETSLRGPSRRLADRRVVLCPVDRGAQHAEQVLEGLLVLGDEQQAQLDEVRPRDRHCTGVLVTLVRRRRWDEVRVVGQ